MKPNTLTQFNFTKKTKSWFYSKYGNQSYFSKSEIAQREEHENLSSIVERQLKNVHKRPFRSVPSTEQKLSAALSKAKEAAYNSSSTIRFNAENKIPLLIYSHHDDHGTSPMLLASSHPDMFVLGLTEKSVNESKASFLASKQSEPTHHNYSVIQGVSAADVWHLLTDSDISKEFHVERHLLCYPRSFSRKKEVGKRIYASPYFAKLLSLGGDLDLRTNWDIYAREFVLAYWVAGAVYGVSTQCEHISVQTVTSKEELDFVGRADNLRLKHGPIYRVQSNLNPFKI